MELAAYDLKLKTGFFKTELYILFICDERIMLVPKENADFQRIIINDGDLNSFTLVNKGTSSFEIEINTQQGIFIGTISTSFNIEELFSILIKKYNGKIFF